MHQPDPRRSATAQKAAKERKAREAELEHARKMQELILKDPLAASQAWYESGGFDDPEPFASDEELENLEKFFPPE
jgi:hypothetical protein